MQTVAPLKLSLSSQHWTMNLFKLLMSCKITDGAYCLCLTHLQAIIVLFANCIRYIPNVYVHSASDFGVFTVPQEVTSQCWESVTLWCQGCCCASSCVTTTTKSKRTGKSQDLVTCREGCSVSLISTALSLDTLWVSGDECVSVIIIQGFRLSSEAGHVADVRLLQVCWQPL